MSELDVEISDYPFRHVVVDDYWSPELLDAVVEEFPDENDRRWKSYKNDKEGKLEGGASMWGEASKELLDRMAGLSSQLSDLFQIRDLEMRTIGGGYHNIPPGGKLGIHADFNRSEDNLYRRLNMLIYLNRDWTDKDGGYLELWDGAAKKCVEKILPVFNRMVIFETSSTSFHGHPEPLPGPRSRRSIAAYFFSPEPSPNYREDHSTVWL